MVIFKNYVQKLRILSKRAVFTKNRKSIYQYGSLVEPILKELLLFLTWDISSRNNFLKDIKDLTPVRGQDGNISDTQGKDFWSPTRLCRVGDQ